MLQVLRPILYEGAAKVLNQDVSIPRACEVELASMGGHCSEAGLLWSLAAGRDQGQPRCSATGAEGD